MRVNDDHWELLLKFCERHPEIITNRINGLAGRQNLNKMWMELSNQLNALGYGEKTVDEWKKSLADWKSKTKQKASKINQSQNQTGGGPMCVLVLSAKEERLLSLMGKTVISGDSALEFGIYNKQEILDSNVNTTVHIKISKPLHICNASLNTKENNILLDSQSGEETADIYEEINTENINPSKSANESVAKPILLGSRKRKSNVLSEQIVELNNETLCVLRSIDNNLSNMVGDIKRLTDAVVHLCENIT